MPKPLLRARLFCGLAVPQHGERVVPCDALPVVVSRTKGILRVGVALLRRLAVPLHGDLSVLGQVAERFLRVCVALFRRLAVPLSGDLVVLLYSVSSVVCIAEKILRLGVALLRCLAVRRGARRHPRGIRFFL